MLRVLPVEKSWGPDYLRLGLKLESSFSQGSTYSLRAALHRTWLNPLGGELIIAAELGSSSGAGVEWLQPLTLDRRWFADVAAGYQRQRVDYFVGEQRVAEYGIARSRAEMAGGYALSLVGTLRAGWRVSKVTQELETGVDTLAGQPERSSTGWLIALDLDQQDSLYVPRHGWAVLAEWFDSDARDYARVAFELRAATSWQDYVIGTRLTWIGSPRGRLPLSETGRLGGFLNLTAFASGQLIGDDVAYAHVRAERIVGRLPLGLRGDMRVGLALEAGKVAIPYSPQQRRGWHNSLAGYVGGETPFGPVYFGVGVGSGRAANAYLFIGTP